MADTASFLNGPVRLVAFRAGVYDHADLPLDRPVHLVGPNNMGKTSLVALLQFLYVDDQRKMRFSHDLTETRKYYFRDTRCWVLFECLCNGVYRVVGVRGLGAMKGHAIERFVFDGKVDVDDFLLHDRTVRAPEEVLARLTPKQYRALEPNDLRMALTGLGQSSKTSLNLVQVQRSGAYDAFRHLFVSVLRLAHLSQDDLKEQIIAAHHERLRTRSISLAEKNEKWGQLERDEDRLAALEKNTEKMRLLLETGKDRNQVRAKMSTLWPALKSACQSSAQTAMAARDAAIVLGEQCRTDFQKAKDRMAIARTKVIAAANAKTLAEHWFTTLSTKEERLGHTPLLISKNAVPTLDAVETKLKTDLSNIEGGNLADLTREEAKLAKKAQALKSRRENREKLFGTLLQHKYGAEGLDAVSRLINPGVLALDTETEIRVSDPAGLDQLVEQVIQGQSAGTWAGAGVAISAEGWQGLASAEAWDDPESLAREEATTIRHLEETRRKMETLRLRESKEKELEGITQSIRKHLGIINDWKALDTEKAEIPVRDATLRQANTKYAEAKQEEELIEKNITALSEKERELQARFDSAKGKIEEAQNWWKRVGKAGEPTPAWNEGPSESGIQDSIVDVESALRQYERWGDEHAGHSAEVQTRLRELALLDPDRFGQADEAAALAAVAEELMGMQERKAHLARCWEHLCIELSDHFKSLAESVDEVRRRLGQLNAEIAKVKVSNLRELRVVLKEDAEMFALLRDATTAGEDGNGLFAIIRNQQDGDRWRRFLLHRPELKLEDLFSLAFEIEGADGGKKTHTQLAAIESNGTTITIKVLVGLLLLRQLLGTTDARVPFYLDECTSLDGNNLRAIVREAEKLGFTAILASPDPAEAAPRLCYLYAGPGGKIAMRPKELVEISWKERG